MSQIKPASKFQLVMMDNLTLKAQQLLCTLYVPDYKFMDSSQNAAIIFISSTELVDFSIRDTVRCGLNFYILLRYPVLKWAKEYSIQVLYTKFRKCLLCPVRESTVSGL